MGTRSLLKRGRGDPSQPVDVPTVVGESEAGPGIHWSYNRSSELSLIIIPYGYGMGATRELSFVAPAMEDE